MKKTLLLLISLISFCAIGQLRVSKPSELIKIENIGDTLAEVKYINQSNVGYYYHPDDSTYKIYGGVPRINILLGKASEWQKTDGTNPASYEDAVSFLNGLFEESTSDIAWDLGNVVNGAKVSDITKGDGIYVAAVSNSGTYGGFYTSKDGVKFTQRNTGLNKEFSGIDYRQGEYVITHDDTDGDSLTITKDFINFETAYTPFNGSWKTPRHNDSLIVSVCNSGNRVMWSKDNRNWFSGTAPAKNYMGVYHGDSISLIYGVMSIAYSYDSKNYVEASITSALIQGIIGIEGKYYALAGGVFQDTTIFESSDGINWSGVATSLDGGYLWNSIANGGGTTVLLSQNGVGRTSTDMVTFTDFALPDTAAYNDMIYDNGKFIAGATVGSGDSATVFISSGKLNQKNQSNGNFLFGEWETTASLSTDSSNRVATTAFVKQNAGGGGDLFPEALFNSTDTVIKTNTDGFTVRNPANGTDLVTNTPEFFKVWNGLGDPTPRVWYDDIRLYCHFWVGGVAKVGFYVNSNRLRLFDSSTSINVFDVTSNYVRSYNSGGTQWLDMSELELKLPNNGAILKLGATAAQQSTFGNGTFKLMNSANTDEIVLFETGGSYFNTNGVNHTFIGQSSLELKSNNHRIDFENGHLAINTATDTAITLYQNQDVRLNKFSALTVDKPMILKEGGIIDTAPISMETMLPLTGLANGHIIEKHKFEVYELSGTVYARVTRDGGDTLTVQFNGTPIKATKDTCFVALTAGADANSLVRNYVYLVQQGDTAALKASTIHPQDDPTIGAYAWAGVTNVFDATTTANNGAFVLQRYNNSISDSDTLGLMVRLAERLRHEASKYEDGCETSLTRIAAGAAIDSIYLSINDGIVYQLHRQGYNITDTTPSGRPYMYIINHPTEPYKRISDLNECIVDANGNSLRVNNRRYGLEIVGFQNSNSGVSIDRVGVLLPSNFYTNDEQAINDVNNYTISSVPTEISNTCFRIARVVLRYTTAASGTLANLSGGSAVQERQGFPLGLGGGGGGQGSEFADNQFKVFDDADPTKIVELQASGITTATTRTLTIPDSSGTIALLSNITPLQDSISVHRDSINSLNAGLIVVEDSITTISDRSLVSEDSIGVLSTRTLASLDSISVLRDSINSLSSNTPKAATIALNESINANTNNWNPTGIDGAGVVTIFVTLDADRDLTGVAAQTAGTVINIINMGGGDLNVSNNNTNSTAANRFDTSMEHFVAPNGSISFVYDDVSDRWVELNFIY